jgi:hypothetical protein
VGALSNSETSVQDYHSMLRNNPEERRSVQESVNRKHLLALMAMFKFKSVNVGMSELHAFFLILPAFLTSNNFCKSNKQIYDVFERTFCQPVN